jgi:hypothetical protein
MHGRARRQQIARLKRKERLAESAFSALLAANF